MLRSVHSSGSGYRLTMTKASDRCDERAIKAIIRERIPESTTISNVSGELAMSLPSTRESQFSRKEHHTSASRFQAKYSVFQLS